MTDRLKGLIVVLDRDIRTDDAEPLIAAIQQMRNVAEVKPIVAEMGDFFERSRVKREILTKLLETVKELTA